MAQVDASNRHSSEVARGVKAHGVNPIKTRKSSRGLRLRLIQLALLAVLPALLLILYGAREQRRNAVELAEHEALRLARILSASHQRLIDSTGYLLVALARVPEIRNGERAGCIELLSELIKEYPPYSHLAAANREGDLFCRTGPAERATNIAERGFFRRAIIERNLSIHENEFVHGTGRTGFKLSYPITDNTGSVAGVVFAAIDLAWFNQIISAVELPKDSTLTLYDRRGRVLAHHPDPSLWVGKAAGDSQIFRTILEKAEAEGLTEARGLDEKKRLYGFTSFGASSGKRDIYLSVGIPVEVALAGANWNLTTNLAALFIVSALALIAAWYAGDVLVLRPLDVLAKATARVAAGNLSTRTGLPHEDDEVGRLAASFDKMAERLEREKAEAATADLRTQKSLQRIKMLHEIDIAITSSLDIHNILEVLLDKIDLVLPEAVTTIRLIDKETGEFARAASRNIDEEYWRTGSHSQLRGLSREVLENRVPTTVLNLQKNPETSRHRFVQRFGLVSYLGVPLIAKGELLGLMAFYTKEEHIFDDEEKDFLVTLGGQLAIAIHNAQLYYDEIKRGASEIAALYALTLAANQSLDLDLILQEATKKIAEIFKFAATRVFLFDHSMDNLDLRAAYEAEPSFWASVSSFRRGRGIVGKVADAGESLIVEDIATDARYAELSQTKAVRNAGTRFAAFLPIKTNRKTWGAIVCVGEHPRQLKTNEMRLLEAMVNQIGIAVENSSLYQQTAARAKELASLYSIAAIAGESLDINVVLQTTMMKVLEIFGFDASRIYLCRGDSRELHLAAARGFPADVRVIEKYQPGETGIGKAFETGEPSFVENMETDADDKVPAGETTMFKAGFRSSFSVPLKIRGSGLGVINCLKRKPYRFSESDRQLIHSIAYHLGVAVGNANLYSTIKEKTLELEMANKAKNEFLGVMSHELRTPLNVIKGYADITRDRTFGEINSEQEYALDKISAHASELSHMINSILQVTRIEADTVTVEGREINTCNLLNELESDYLVRANKEVAIAWQQPAYLPPLWTDDEKLKAILQNLVNNALKFTERGTVTVSAAHLRKAGRVEFRVADTGPGIARDKLPIIFDMFKQADSSATRKHEGAGLGLYIVKKFVDLLGGQISVQSEPGDGSVFIVSLPLHSHRPQFEEMAAQHS